MDIFNTTDAEAVAQFSQPNMMFYEDRLMSFHWWSKQIKPDGKSLAAAGFYYSGCADKVICFACNMRVCKWEPTDDPWAEHLRLSPTCLYLKITGYETGNTNPPQRPNGNRAVVGQFASAQAAPAFSLFGTGR